MNVNFAQSNITQPSFQRRLREDEKPEFSKTMNEAFDYLGVNTRALIIHGSSFPDEVRNPQQVENYTVDTVKNKNPYIGSPYFNHEFLNFAKMNGFNAIQLGPNGKLNKADNSPYKSSIYAKNELFVDYERLKTKEYANILSDKDTQNISYINQKQNGNYDMTDFDGAKEVASTVLKKAYDNFKTKLENNEPEAVRLNNEFENYKDKNNNWLEKSAIFSVLSDIHGSDKFTKWNNKLDANLISRKNSGDKAAKLRYEQLTTNHKQEIDEFEFKQFITSKQEKEDKALREEAEIKYIGDLLVGYSSADEWSNPDAFLKDWRVGAEYGGKNDTPQTWGIPVLNPSKLFNEDGTLGTSGQLLKQKINSVLEGVENIRIDNAMGLVDPYIYKSSTVKADGTIDRANGGYMSHIIEVDPEHNYSKILHNILLPSLRENNIDPKDVVWEDLGAQSQMFKDVFYDGKVGDKVYEDEKMKGIMYSIGVQMEKYGDNATYSFMSTHDNEPSVRLLKQNWIKSNEGWNPMYLAGYLIPPINDEKAKISAEFCRKIESDPKTKLKAKYAELFRGTKNIQVSFADFFGIDKVYNHAGRNDVKDNWKLRLNSDYQDTYYKSVETGNEPAMNMPELLGLAVNSKAGISIAKKEMDDEQLGKVADLQTRLAHWNEVLKESE